MSIDLQLLPLEELEKEIHRRKSSQVGELKNRIKELHKAIEEEEAKLRNLEDLHAASAEPTRRSAAPSWSKEERVQKIKAAFEPGALLGSTELEERVGFGGVPLRLALGTLLEDGFLVREGKARATRYRMA